LNKSHPIYPAIKYAASDDICVICCYFNPNNYTTKLSNYRRFFESLHSSGIFLYTIELAFINQEFQLKKSPFVKQIRGATVLWQKEKLLNRLLPEIPLRFKKIIWADSDILFENTNWLCEASKQLEKHFVIQPFKYAIRLPKNDLHYSTYGEKHKSFCATYNLEPHIMTEAGNKYHGHTGFAWGARRDVIEKIGFYDVCLSGSGDELMAHAFVGDLESRFIKRIVGEDEYFFHFRKWGGKMSDIVKSNIGYVEGHILHLWHGQSIDRHYFVRDRELIKMKFDPCNDLIMDDNGLWKWNSNKPELHKWAKTYFGLRNEDGI
jgi:hypothetical protein